MAYTQNEKSTGLDPLVPVSTSLVIMGDPADSGRAKKSTIAQVATTILTYIQASLGGLVQSVTGLNTDNSDPANPVVQISVDGVTITGDGTPGNPLVATAGGSGNGTFNGKVKSYSLEGLQGSPIQNGYQNIESYITSNGTTIYAEIDPEFLQTRDIVSDWASATQVNSYVVNQGFLFLLLQDTATNAYRVYRYPVNNLAAGGTLMTIATQTLGTQDFMMMTSDGTDFYFNYAAGNSANDYEISPYTISGTTLTYTGSDITCGAIANATNVFIVSSTGDIYGLNTVGTRQIKKFDSSGTLLNTYTPYDVNYTNIINWTDSIYIVKSAGDDEAYRITEGNLSSSSSKLIQREDFLGGEQTPAIAGAGTTGELGWVTVGNTVVSRINGLDEHPGIQRLTGDVSANGGGLALGRATAGTYGGYGPVDQANLRIEHIIKLGNAANETLFGLTDNLVTGTYTNNVVGKLALVSASNVWQGYYVDTAGGTQTTSSGTVATSTNWVNLTITTDSTGSNAEFFVDGVSLGSVAIGTGSNQTPSLGIIGNTDLVDIDFVLIERNITR